MQVSVQNLPMKAPAEFITCVEQKPVGHLRYSNQQTKSNLPQTTLEVLVEPLVIPPFAKVLDRERLQLENSLHIWLTVMGSQECPKPHLRRLKARFSHVFLTKHNTNLKQILYSNQVKCQTKYDPVSTAQQNLMT